MTKRDYTSRDKSGTHICSPPRRIRRRTAAQSLWRNAHRTAATWWKTLPTPTQRVAWQIFASQHPKKGKRGLTYTMTAYQAFMNRNIYRAYNNVDPWLDPPED